MTKEIITVCVLLLHLTDSAFSQYSTMYVGSPTPLTQPANPPGVPYEKTQQEMVNNFLYNKPLLNYIPVYNTAYGHWNGETDKLDKMAHDVKTSQVSYQHVAAPKFNADMDMEKLGQVINRLKMDMHALSQKTKLAYEGKLKELHEVKKLNDDLKGALQNTDVLRSTLCEHEKQLVNLRKNILGRSDLALANPAGVQDFLKMIESLELMVRNISSKYGGVGGGGGKTGM